MPTRWRHTARARWPCRRSPPSPSCIPPSTAAAWATSRRARAARPSSPEIAVGTRNRHLRRTWTNKRACIIAPLP
eukprot:scaffold12066_cov104-Isochrysis_galbana.AAC.1